jgi:F0F1-type ATP synthase assembly protein I
VTQEGPGSKRGNQDSEAAWGVVGYLVSGLVAWGGVGALADHFFDTSLFVPIGLALGACLGLYLVWVRYGKS